jgi:hypothetical protein
MLATPQEGNTGGLHGSGGRGGGGEHNPRGASNGGDGIAGMADVAGPSRHRASGGSRHGDERSTSGAD